MSKDKNLKQKIIKSAFNHFSQAPFKKVSTNQIVEDADVSKGLLFHYFHDKKNLYMTLYDIAWQSIHKQILEAIDFSNRCLFKRLKDFMLMRNKALKEQKVLSAFMKQVHLSQDPYIIKERTKIYTKHQEKVYKLIFDHIDTDSFREDINLNDSYKIIIWTLQRIGQDWEKHHTDKDPKEALSILDHELDHYINFMQKVFYK